MADISPRVNSPDQSDDRSPENVSEILSTARALSAAVETLASAIANGSGIERAEARDRFEIALTEFSEAIDDTEE
jgi:hypothetical protein